MSASSAIVITTIAATSSMRPIPRSSRTRVSIVRIALALEVEVEQRMAGEERHHGAEREKRPERDAHLPGRRAVPDDEDDRREERGEHSEEDGDGHRAAEHRAEQKGELHVAHAHAGRVDK